ncbi:MAG: YkgJ family cysteine cluster protein [Candidatus Nanoarchaeia archaeon]|nr:YkgJ family cysteine cluster protein [Candidatus Nanoarchaeia archaeon]
MQIKENNIFKDKTLCETCGVLCSREQKFHWLMSDEAQRLKYELPIEKKGSASFFEGGLCQKLKNSSCSIYESRPLECRLAPIILYSDDSKNLFWAIDVGCNYFKKYSSDKKFFDDLNTFINSIEPYITKEMEPEFIAISEAVKEFDSFIEGKELHKIRKFKQRN